MYVESRNARTDRLISVFSNPLSEVYLLFFEAALQVFMHINTFLQREDPIISVMHSQLISFLKKLLGRFIKAAVIRSIDNKDISSLDIESQANQLQGKTHMYCAKSLCLCNLDNDLFIGIVTRQHLRKLEEGGDVTSRQVQQFYTAVRGFYLTAAKYAIDHLPLNDQVLQSASFVDFSYRTSASISQVNYFISR